MCVYKTVMLNKRYLPNKKNKGIPPECPDERLRYIEAKCGKCYECRKEKVRSWVTRMTEELRENKGEFYTMTINDEHMEELRIAAKKKYDRNEINDIARVAVRRFLERYRKFRGMSVKHWFVTELGEKKGRLHLHGILFGENTTAAEIQARWMYGNVFKGQWVNEQTVRYITKYMLKESEDDKEYVGIVLCSPGIGKGYIDRRDAENNKYKEEETKRTYTFRNGTEMALPRYYAMKIYSDEEREKLNIIMQERGKIWIGGEEVDATDEKTINQLTDYYRKKYKRIQNDDAARWQREKELKRKIAEAKYREKSPEELKRELFLKKNRDKFASEEYW